MEVIELVDDLQRFKGFFERPYSREREVRWAYL